MGQIFPKASINLPVTKSSDIILSKIYDFSFKERAIKSLVKNLSFITLMDIKTNLLGELLHNTKLSSKKFNRYACILAVVDETLAQLRKENEQYQVVRSNSVQSRTITPGVGPVVPPTRVPSITAHYNVSLSHNEECLPANSPSVNGSSAPTAPPSALTTNLPPPPIQSATNHNVPPAPPYYK